MAVMEGYLDADIESGDLTLESESSISASSESDPILTKTCGFPHFNGFRGQVDNVSNTFVPNSGIECRDHLVFEEKGNSKQKHWKPNSNRHSKPPRPPKGPLLDASDMLLVEKISEIAVKKRERIEKLRALKKKKKEAKSSLSCCSIVAMVITVLFFVFILFQGLCSRGGIEVRFQGSPEPSMANNGLISVQLYSVPPASEINGAINRYPKSDEPASGSWPRVEEGRDSQYGVFRDR